MAGKADTRWLEQRRQGWYAVLYVPVALRPVLGNKLRQSLGTRDLLAAQKARHAVLGEFRKRVELAEAEARDALRRPPAHPFEAEGATWADALRQARQADADANGDGGPDDVTQEALVRDALIERAEQVERKRGRSSATPLSMAARGETPLLQHASAWLREGGVKGPYEARTKLGHERNLASLKAWLEAEGQAATIESVTKRQAGRYVSSSLVPSGREAKTLASIVSSLRSYWTFLARKGLVGDDTKNPWDGQAPPKARQKGTGEDPERAFTDAELTLLLGGKTDEELADLMPFAALSGMRIEEIYRLTVKDCEEGWFNIRKAKTKAGVRRVPIHPRLAPIVARRSKDKGPRGFLFHEAGDIKEGRERSMAASKRFGHYRKRCKVDEMEAGRRRSLVNFHSFRRWFITAASRADQPERIVQQVVGHKAQGMTMGVYFGGDLPERLTACVMAVQLPGV